MPTYNRADWLRDALATLASQTTHEAFDVEIVVVDNDSTDATRQIIEEAATQMRWPVKYVRWTRRGDAQARNGGIPHCRGDWIAFMDDDELAASDWLWQMFSVARDRSADLVGGAVHLEMSPARIAKLGLDVRRSLRERTAATAGGGEAPRRFLAREFPGTDNLMISRRVLESLNSFDETLMAGTADYDFSVRARRAGFDCWFVPQAIVRHRTPANRLTSEFIAWDSIRSGVMLAQYDRKYKGLLATWGWMGLRTIQGLGASLPKWICGRATGNEAAASNGRVRWLRSCGYARGFLCEAFPLLFSRRRLYDRLDFIKGRQIGTGPNPSAPAGSGAEPSRLGESDLALVDNLPMEGKR